MFDRDKENPGVVGVGRGESVLVISGPDQGINDGGHGWHQRTLLTLLDPTTWPSMSVGMLVTGLQINFHESFCVVSSLVHVEKHLRHQRY